jgi:hypothetical protein
MYLVNVCFNQQTGQFQIGRTTILRRTFDAHSIRCCCTGRNLPAYLFIFCNTTQLRQSNCVHGDAMHWMVGVRVVHSIGVAE